MMLDVKSSVRRLLGESNQTACVARKLMKQEESKKAKSISSYNDTFDSP